MIGLTLLLETCGKVGLPHSRRAGETESCTSWPRGKEKPKDPFEDTLPQITKGLLTWPCHLKATSPPQNTSLGTKSLIYSLWGTFQIQNIAPVNLEAAIYCSTLWEVRMPRTTVRSGSSESSHSASEMVPALPSHAGRGRRIPGASSIRALIAFVKA